MRRNDRCARYRAFTGLGLTRTGLGLTRCGVTGRGITVTRLRPN